MVLLVAAETPPETWHDRWQSFCCWCNREPQLTIRHVVWIATAGFFLCLCYGAAALLFAFTVIFVPFVWPALQLAGFIFNPIGKQAIPHERTSRARCDMANLVWSILFGWLLTLLLLLVSALQMGTIIGLPTAFRFVELARFTMRPFGKDVVPKSLPTSVEEMNPRRSDYVGQRTNIQMTSNGQPLHKQGEEIGPSFV